MSGERMQLLAFKPVRKDGSTLRGFASIELPIGLRILDCPVHRAGNGKTWAGLPARPKIETGQLVRGASGEIRHTPQLLWRDARLNQAFSDRVIELIGRYYPGALE